MFVIFRETFPRKKGLKKGNPQETVEQKLYRSQKHNMRSKKREHLFYRVICR